MSWIMTDREVKVSNKEAFGRVFDGSWFWTFSRPSPLDVELSVDICSSRILRKWHGVCVFNNLPHRTFQAKSANQPLCVLDLVSFFLGSFVTDLRCLNPYWAKWFTIFVVDCMRKDRLPSDVYVDLTCKFGDHGLVSPVRGRLIGGIFNFDSDALIWIRTPIPFVDPSLLPH